MLDIMAHTPHRLPAHKPRLPDGRGHARGPGAGRGRGVDMFDCVMPTRNARNGTIFTRYGDLKIRNARHRPTTSRSIPAAPATPARARTAWRGTRAGAAVSRAPTCTTWTACGEMLGPMLTTIHNLHYYLNLMRRSARALDAGTFSQFRAQFKTDRARAC